jgi:hypothetical protein
MHPHARLKSNVNKSLRSEDMQRRDFHRLLHPPCGLLRAGEVNFLSRAYCKIFDMSYVHMLSIGYCAPSLETAVIGHPTPAYMKIRFVISQSIHVYPRAITATHHLVFL